MLTKVIITAVIFFFILILVMFPEARALFKGFGRLFVKNLAETPEGAEAIYMEKINELTESYNKADNAFRSAAGKYEQAKKELQRLQAAKERCENACKMYVAKNQIEEAKFKAQEREEILSSYNKTFELMKQYEAATEKAKQVHQMCEDQLRKMKQEKEEVVRSIEEKQNLAKLYDNLDDLKMTSGVDKMLDAVRERDKELSEIVAGAEVVHNSKTSTKRAMLEKQDQLNSADEFLQSLLGNTRETEKIGKM